MDLVARLRLQDDMSGKMRKVTGELGNAEKQTRSLTDRMGGLKSALAGLGVTAGIGALAKGIVGIGVEFDTQMSKVKAISGATEEQFQALRGTARQLGKDTKYTMTQAGEAMEYLALAGWKTDAIISAMPGMLSLAAAGALDLGRAADITSDTMQAFGIDASKATHVADVFAYAQANANTNVEQLGEAMTYIAPVANAMGWSLEQTAAGIMAVSDAGVKGSMAGQAFATSMARLAKPTRAMNETMAELNMELFDSGGNLKSLPDLVGELEVATKGMTREQRSNVLSTMFGAQAYKHWAIMLERGSDELGRMTGELENADGAATRMADTMMDNLGGQWELFKSGMAEAAYSIYEYFEPALRDAVKVGIKFAAIIPPAAKAIANFAKPFKPLGKAVLIAVGAVGAFLGMIVGIKLLAIAFGMLMSPIGLAIIAITGIVLAFQFAYKHIEPFRELIEGAGRGLQGFWALLQGNEGKGASLLMSTGMTKETYFKIKEFADGIVKAGEKLQQAKGAISGFYDAITNGGGTSDGLREMLESEMSMDQIKRVYEFANQLRPAFDAVKQAFVTFKEGLASGSVGGFMEALGFSPEAIASVEGTIASLLGVFESVKSAVSGFIESVSPTVASLMETFRSFGTTLMEVFSAAWAVLAPVFDGISIAIGIIGEVATMVFNNIIVPGVTYAIQMFQLLWTVVGPILDLLGAAIELAFGVLKIVWDTILSPFLSFMTGAFKSGLEAATPIIDRVGGAFQKVGDFVSGLADMVRDFATALKNVKVPDWVSTIGGKIAGAARSVGSFLSGGNVAVPGNFHGIDRVPYDNYLTRLHRGERVLTRQEANEYEGMDYATASAGVSNDNRTYNYETASSDSGKGSGSVSYQFGDIHVNGASGDGMAISQDILAQMATLLEREGAQM